MVDNINACWNCTCTIYCTLILPRGSATTTFNEKHHSRTQRYKLLFYQCSLFNSALAILFASLIYPEHVDAHICLFGTKFVIGRGGGGSTCRLSAMAMLVCTVSERHECMYTLQNSCTMISTCVLCCSMQCTSCAV